MATGLLAAADGDPEAAVAHLDRAEQLYRPGFYPDVRPVPALRARVWIRQGLLAAAADWARERGVSATDAAEYLHEFDHLTLARLLVAQHRARPGGDAAQQAVDLLDRLRAAAEASGRAGSLVEVRLLTALALDAQGRRPQALASLADAWTLSPEPEAYRRLFLDEGAPMVELLQAVQRDPVVGHHARRLLAVEPPHRAGGAGAARPGIPPLADPLSERELQVLRMLDSELSGPQIAAALFISPNTLRTHTKHVFTKLGVTSRRAAVLRARERGLMPPASD